MTINDQIRETSVSKRTCPPRNIDGAVVGPMCAWVRTCLCIYTSEFVHMVKDRAEYIVDIGGIHRRSSEERRITRGRKE